MKTTPFYEKHIALGARMIEFAGYKMPVYYSGIQEEHLAVRKNAGVFDVSHMGEFILKGPQALPLIQWLTCNDVARLKKGQAQYNCFINEKGGIKDDLIVYCLEENNAYLLVVNAANIEKNRNWIEEWNNPERGIIQEKAEFHDISERTCLLAVQGPNAAKIIQPLTDMDILNLKYYTFVKGVFAGVKNVLISATGYTGAGGVEIYFENQDHAAEKIWEALFSAGRDAGLKPAGLGARDTLRLEMGYCLYGNDIDESTTPLEAGLGWIVKLNKNFIGKDILEKQKHEGITQKLIGFELLHKGIPRQGYEIADREGNIIGRVTSGSQSPMLNKAIGLGYVPAAFANIGNEIFIRIRDKSIPALVSKIPFV
ncbi:MAG: glycine cleavage system aminomethyltransferase GcvT [Chitinophagaceae bacterium]|nr:glycine cleavage system aminomethyltransferase GcvT [Chitinophagaceae bacterium]